MEETGACSRCGESGPEIDVTKCPICYKLVCHRCAVAISGRPFCSQSCADYFFHGDEEDLPTRGSDE